MEEKRPEGPGASEVSEVEEDRPVSAVLVGLVI